MTDDNTSSSSILRSLGMSGAILLALFVGGPLVLGRGGTATLGSVLMLCGAVLLLARAIAFALPRMKAPRRGDEARSEMRRLLLGVLAGGVLFGAGAWLAQRPDLLFHATGMDSPLLPWNR